MLSGEADGLAEDRRRAMAGFSILALVRHILVGMLGVDDHEFGVSAGRLARRPRERGARGDVFDAHDNPMVLNWLFWPVYPEGSELAKRQLALFDA